VSTAVKLGEEESDAFPERVGIHQGSVQSPLLITVMEEMWREFKIGFPWEFLYTGDLVLIAESEKLMDKLRVWKNDSEGKRLKVNARKTN
jgi:hypothetical protein